MKSHRGLVSIFGISLILIILASGFFLMGVSRADSDASVQGKKATGKIALHATGRGNPWINLRDGVELKTAYMGAAGLRQMLEQNLASPTALASADFDEDGVPDLVSGYVGPGGGILTLHRGNVDSIYPNSPEAKRRKASGVFTDAPFLSPARVFELAEAPDFLGAGDFDADGHWDIVAAAQGGDKLYWLAGDGRGGLNTARRVRLPGAVTALITGEINRRDGLTDVVVGIVGSDGPAVLVFEWPEGALRGEPEVLATPAEVRALALGQLDEHYCMDLAVAAGSELVIVHGRDRRLSLDEIRRAEVLPATIDQLSFPFAITSVAVGDFLWEQGYQLELALLAGDGPVHLLGRTTGSQGARGLRSKGSAENWELVDSLCLSSAPLLLRSSTPHLLVAARVSSLPTDDLVLLDSTNHQLHILTTNKGQEAIDKGQMTQASLDLSSTPVAVLPMRLNVDALSDLVILKEGASDPAVALTAAMATFTVNSPGDNGDLNPGDGVCETGNILPNGERECTLRAAIHEANASIGADTINFDIGSGVQIITPVTVEGFLPSGTCPSSALPLITDPVTIDGTTQPVFAGDPIIELNGCIATECLSNIRHCENQLNGLLITAGSCVVRGLVVDRWVQNVSLHRNGNTFIEGNFIGLDITGTAAPPVVFQRGLSIHSQNNSVGGTTAAGRNVISGNDGEGIALGSSNPASVTGNLIQGNFIGTDKNGNAPVGNGLDVQVDCNRNTIGGLAHGARNVISDGREGAVWITGAAQGNLIQGNFIGTGKDGIGPLGNHGLAAIVIISGSSNTVSSNTIAFTGGPDQNGLNGGVGVALGTATDNMIASNTIAFNSSDAVLAFEFQGEVGPTKNAILQNSILSNGGLGINLTNVIDLAPDGTLITDRVTPNDPGDGDLGANNLQNYPVLTSASTSGSSTTIQATLNSTANTTFRLEFFSNTACDPSGFGEGETFMSSTTVTTDGSGNVGFMVTFPTALPLGQFITATATDPNNNTSEFSQCVVVETLNQPPVAVCQDVTVSPGPNCTASASVDHGSFDPDGDAITITQEPPGPYPLGTTTVTLTVTDEGGASDSCAATVTVVDDTPPAITCAASQTLSADASCRAVVPDLTSGAAVSDNCSAAGSITVTQSPAAGTVIGLGTTMVTLTATDAAGNKATCSSAVTVTDTEAPMTTAAFNPTGAQNNDDEGVLAIVCHATDNCDPHPTLTALIEVPILVNPEIEFKVKKEKKLMIDVKKNKVEVEGPDPVAFWAEVQTANGIGVSDGQRVEIKLKKNPDKFEYEFDELAQLKKIEAPQVTLRCTATDASGNEGTATANPPLIPDAAADSQ